MYKAFPIINNNSKTGDLDIIAGESHTLETCKALLAFLNEMNLVDVWRTLYPNRKSFTWSRGNIARRLDYIFVDQNLTRFIKKADITSLGFSDHRMVTTSIDATNFKFGKGLYKLNTSLLSDVAYCKITIDSIIETSKEYCNLNPHLRWEMIKVNCKEVSQQYARYKACNRQDYLAECRKKLKVLEEQFVNNPHNSEVRQRIVKIKAELELKELEVTKGAKIRSGIKFMEEGEKCTKYFLSLEKQRSKSNTIMSINDEKGSSVSDEKEIVDVIAKSFHKKYNNFNMPYNDVSQKAEKFASDLSIPTLSQEDLELCDETITIEELNLALESMNRGSAPGSDGLPLEWYVTFWPHIKNYLLENFNYSFTKGYLSASQRLGVIALFHKGKELAHDNLDNWRPISLLNTDYKILAKVLSIRLSSVIDKLIGSQQVGFMKGRNISYIIRRIDDLLNIQKRSNANGIILALDFKQAFDSVSMQYILNSLKIF
jgi:hypothetical protein